MSRLTRGLVAAAGAALATAALVVPSAADATSTSARPGVAHACSQQAKAGYANCFAQIRTLGAKPMTSKLPAGYGPADIRSAYNLTSAASPTVAIVDAFDNPNAEADLAVYRSQYGLPACTTANGCFKKVNQTGGSTPPAGDTGWGAEIALDVDMVSAACPNCKILLVEANSNSFANLAAAVNYAATQGVAAISNSYGGGDQGQIAAYNHPGIAIVASTGDSGYGVSSPASFKTVVAVGGTSLTHAGNARGWKETAWNGAGSGCSTQNPRPPWQRAAVTQCPNGKANADVSAVADPNTGVAVYDTYGFGGWLVFGGTSASAPIIGSVYAMAGHLAGYPAKYTWTHKSGLYDVKAGSNGSCPTAVWCHAGPGWDGPTGLGTPNGLTSF